MQLLTFTEAAKFLNVPESWLRKKVAARAVPFTRLGRHVRFSEEHLLSIIQQGEQMPLVAPARRRYARSRLSSAGASSTGSR